MESLVFTKELLETEPLSNTTPVRSWLSKFMFFRVDWANLAFWSWVLERSTSLKVVRERSASLRFTFLNSAPLKLAWERPALAKFTSMRSTPLKLAAIRLQAVKSVFTRVVLRRSLFAIREREKFALVRFALLKSAAVRSTSITDAWVRSALLKSVWSDTFMASRRAFFRFALGNWLSRSVAR